MFTYQGQMSDSHLRAAVRVALAARGLEFEPAYFAAQSAAQWELGLTLRREIIADIPGGHSFDRLEDLEPDLWRRVPLIAGLGYRQTALFQSISSCPHLSHSDLERQAAILGGAFNLVITLVDHCIDERGAGESIFLVLNEAVIKGIFASPGKAAVQLQLMARESQTLAEQFLLSLIALCCSYGENLLALTGNNEAWKSLGGVILLLLQSERELAAASWASPSEMRRMLPSVETKSALPSLACMHIACLAHAPSESEVDGALRATAERIGKLFWRIDDIVDLLKDWRSGSPNALLLPIADRLDREKRAYASDTDIYDEVEACAEEIASLAELGQHAIATGNDQLSGSPQEVKIFAWLLLAGWTGWRETHASPRHVHHAGDAAVRSSELALRYLMQQHDHGYEEATHYLHFPRLVDGRVRYETCPSILSHRAVIFDALLDGVDAGFRVSQSLLARDAMTILQCKHPDVRGGWSYIQQAPELPPDADDLGQVLQVLVRYGGQDLASICDEAIRLVLDGANDDGGFDTWILDPCGNSFADQKIRDYLPVMGGSGVHVEVVANLLYGLLLYDPQRYRHALHRAVHYLEGTQSAEGSWHSKWYAGPYYGTWRVISVLSRLAPASASLMHARRFLFASQRPNGGWGEHASDPLSTSLALLSLCSSVMAPVEEVIARGVDYLVHSQGAEGWWPSCPWICFPTADGMVTHGSASATTAFCLKALIARQEFSVLQYQVELSKVTYE